MCLLLIVDVAWCRRRCTVRDFVTKHLDINAVPRRYFWELLSQFTDDEVERDKLEAFCMADGQARRLRKTCTYLYLRYLVIITHNCEVISS